MVWFDQSARPSPIATFYGAEYPPSMISALGMPVLYTRVPLRQGTIDLYLKYA